MRGITKSFGAVKANEAVDLSVAPGEILGLLGENGAGKTTLMNVLFGAYAPDAGEILIQSSADISLPWSSTCNPTDRRPVEPLGGRVLESLR